MMSQVSKTRDSINGFLLLDKPLGISSNLALQKSKRLYNAKKAGHTGSLDPLASGMLPICFGEATKFSRFILEADKCYDFTMQLGVTTTSGDCEGEILAVREVPLITEQMIADLITRFQGPCSQLPPMFSAIKYQGQPLYKLARQGKAVERAPRMVNIHQLCLNSMDLNTATLSFTAKCSKGTYIRTLAEDMGEYLGCGAHVTVLRRLWGAPFEGYPMITLETLEQNTPTERHAHLLPVTDVLEKFFPTAEIDAQAALFLAQGKILPQMTHLPAGLLILKNMAGAFLGLGELLPDYQLVPRRMVEQNP